MGMGLRMEAGRGHEVRGKKEKDCLIYALDRRIRELPSKRISQSELRRVATPVRLREGTLMNFKGVSLAYKGTSWQKTQQNVYVKFIFREVEFLNTNISAISKPKNRKRFRFCALDLFEIPSRCLVPLKKKVGISLKSTAFPPKNIRLATITS